MRDDEKEHWKIMRNLVQFNVMQGCGSSRVQSTTNAKVATWSDKPFVRVNTTIGKLNLDAIDRIESKRLVESTDILSRYVPVSAILLIDC